jgi:REP element-mobilizing transposase RayT
MSRGNRRECILQGEDDKRQFLETLGEACDKTQWMIHAYVLMENHFHMLLETPEPNLSEGMRWLQGTYGNRYNRRHGLVGHVWQGRQRFERTACRAMMQQVAGNTGIEWS